MGSGIHGGFGKTKGANNANNKDISVGDSNGKDSSASDTKLSQADANNSPSKVSLPQNQSQLNHIFGERSGHIADTEANRKLLSDLANDPSKFVGRDRYGNSWNAENNSDGSQTWVSYRDGRICNGGKNITPRNWDTSSGFNNNPFKKG
ncbi:MAG: hypothetical protein K6G50_10440 [bacterium]|nr:hypothetical protein [bacterium]